jgi:hypothetical protein
MVTGGHIRLHAPVSTLRAIGDIERFSLDDIVCGKVDGITNPPSVPRRLIQWDDGSVAKEEDIGFLLFDSWSNADSAHVSGLIIQPTGRKHGQFRRLGVLERRVDGLDTFLHRATNPEYLPKDWYEASDPEKGFTIELV